MSGVRVPAGVALVTPDWVGRSIAKQQLQPADQFQPGFLTAPPPPPPAPAPSTSGGAAQQAPPEQQQQQEQAGPAVEEPAPASSVATRPFTEQEREAAQHGVVDSRPAAGGGHEQPPPALGSQVEPRELCRLVRRGSEWVAVKGVKPQYTGGLGGWAGWLAAGLPGVATGAGDCALPPGASQATCLPAGVPAPLQAATRASAGGLTACLRSPLTRSWLSGWQAWDPLLPQRRRCCIQVHSMRACCSPP